MTGPENHSKVPEPVPPLPLPEFAYADLDRQERIGTGGDANVYRATLEHDGYTYSVAIKEPRFEGTIQKRTIEKFQNEAETWAGLNDHDNIVSVYSWGAQPIPWLALEHMDGGTLETRIGDADIAEALWLAGRIAEGIRYGHRHGVAHLDIKPTNILLRETGPESWNYPKVSDWGLAKLLLEHSNSVEGISPTYAAPEQFDAEEFGSPDDITDIYQLGTVVYALVTGEPPFRGSSTAVMRSVLDDEPRPPSEVNSEVPSDVDEIVLKALAKRKGDRYEGILPFRKALDELFVEVADTAITSGTTDQSSTGRGESITPAAARDDSDSGTGTEQTKSATSRTSARSSSNTQSTDSTGPLTRRRALGLLGLGLGGAGGLWVMGGSNDEDPSNGDAAIGVNSPTQSPQPTATQSETSGANKTADPGEPEILNDEIVGSFNKAKAISVTSPRGSPTVRKAQPLYITQGDESATGTGAIRVDFSNINQESDIAVVDQSGALLHYEIEQLDTSSGKGVIWIYNEWIRNDTTQMNLIYDNEESTSYEQAGEVWNNSNQRAIFTHHLEENSGRARDSSPEQIHSASTIDTTYSVSSSFSVGRGFSGGQIKFGDPPAFSALNIGQELTVVTWAKTRENTKEQVIFSKSSQPYDSNISVGIWNEQFRFFVDNPSGGALKGQIRTGFTPENRVPYQFGGIYDGSGRRAYINGSTSGTNSTPTESIDDSQAPVRIGSDANSNQMDGVIFDVRVYNDVKGPNWWQADYEASFISDITFFSQGPVFSL